MSCPPKNQDKNRKPPAKKDMDYVWQEIMGNPNLYCWIPVSTKITNPLQTNIDKLNIQDIPQPKNFSDAIVALAEEATQNKKDDSLKRLHKKASLVEKVSVDDPKKYPIVKAFIKERGLKVYGGIAINSYLPKEAQFYNPNDIPDYDFFSPDPWNDATDLADRFHQKGYKFVEARAGIHKGTYKVLVDMWPVADISYMPQTEFDKIPVTVIDGLNIVSPLKLLESMYKEFSEPYANPSRWPKVASREKLLQKWVNPLGEKFKCSNTLFTSTQLEPTLVKLLNKTYKYILAKKMLLTGSLAYNMFIEIGGGTKRLSNDHYCILSENAHENIQELHALLLKTYGHLEITTQFYPSRELNNTTYSIFAIIDNEYKLICEIVQLTSCTPYIKIGKINIVSVDYLMYELFDSAIFANTTQKQDDAKCAVQYLMEIREKYYKDKGISDTDKSPLQRFVTKCKGPFQENIKVEVMNRWLERQAEKGNVIQEWSKDYKIRKIPHEKIPEECFGKNRGDCRYPCAWNKYVGRCSGIPRGTYRPDEIDQAEYLGGGQYE